MQYSAMSNIQLTVYNAIGVSDATGSLTFTLPAGLFTSVITVQAQTVRDTVTPATACFACVRSFSTTQVVVQVFESKTSSIQSIEGLEKTSVATTVLLNVFGID